MADVSALSAAQQRAQALAGGQQGDAKADGADGPEPEQRLLDGYSCDVGDDHVAIVSSIVASTA
jgi:hypothetical protein